MKTGLITFHFAHHYGAQLQAYATMRAIQGLGHECEIIDFRLPHTTRTNELFKKSRSVRAMASDAHTALHYPAFKARYDRFNAFVAEQMVLSPRQYTSFRQLKEDPPAYDVYVAGSDQIWNPNIFADKQFEPAFLLDFVRQGRKIAYAPSLGTPVLPPPYDAQFKGYLASFDALSAREKRGQVLIREVAGRDARVVLDPTLLLTAEQWGELALPPKEQGPYILCYFVSDPGEVAPYAQALSERTGWPIVQLAGARRKIPGAKELVFDAGPREFLGLFQHAACVCTNSFHGSVFSLQFDRPFFTSMSPKERADPTWSRIYSLLSRLGCADRIVGLDSTAPVDAPMDYAAIHARLAEARSDSLAYLKAAVEGSALPPERPEEVPEAGRKRPVLCASSLCTGCTACASICPTGAISMVPDHEGFLRPAVSDACVLCHKCEQTCPILHPRPAGPAPERVHAVWNADEDERLRSSSGGFFSLLAHWTLEQGGAVFGTVLDETMTARHVCARTEAELAPMRGSKYVQSDLGSSFRQARDLLEQGVPVLFSGVPCQIDGLRRYLGKDYDGLVTCDLVCHGVPSPAVFRAYLDRLEETHGGAQVTGVRFKDKSHGWSHPYFTASFADGSVYTEDFNHTGYGRGFGMQLFLRPSCPQCRYTNTSRPADFTLADYWGLDPKLSLPVDRDKGISMVLVDSPKGEALFQKLAPRFGQVERPLAEAVAGNPRLASPLKANAKRNAFFASFRARPFAETEKDFLSLPPLPYRMAAKALTPRMKQMIRKVLK
ncbi:polysaccharide pyruvyl transferase family protein [Pseudoflavonifractor sp. MSJ-37]|uniref:polysaccharide pyruvyl transferase family protein n=1 Tax=Pseudoflavonifractor sp. MSJ-37 TaxID=2841531 RepID=UPI001C11765D|nr:polysaccharide pyruvyl transferase family protein [Pseudoflavonifractor sp. MSJ-37]MBU5434324.1 polysaccharide pyruvyl transferase family protein [Pseudoflavonifractor sp. MSJ-37]